MVPRTHAVASIEAKIAAGQMVGAPRTSQTAPGIRAGASIGLADKPLQPTSADSSADYAVPLPKPFASPQNAAWWLEHQSLIQRAIDCDHPVYGCELPPKLPKPPKLELVKPPQKLAPMVLCNPAWLDVWRTVNAPTIANERAGITEKQAANNRDKLHITMLELCSSRTPDPFILPQLEAKAA